MLPPTVAMFLICGDAVSNDGHAVADGQRFGRQHLFIRHQKRRGRVARAVEVGLRGLLDLRVARAAAEIAGHGGVDLLARGMGVAVEQRLGRHDHSGRAVAALDGAGVDKRLLQRVRLVGGADALDGLDCAAVRLDGEHTARVDRAPVHDDRAGAAFAKVTALLRARQVRALAQHVQKRLLRLHRERAALAVERQVNRVVVFKHDVLSPVQNLLFVPYWPVSAALCAAAGLSLTGERASHILFFARGHILSRAGATALEGPFFVWATVYYLFRTKQSV